MSDVQLCNYRQIFLNFLVEFCYFYVLNSMCYVWLCQGLYVKAASLYSK